jgi:hypothetical protein
MTIEYVLLIVCFFMIGLKSFFSAPREAFRDYGPVLGARVEKHLATGHGFRDESGKAFQWNQAK